MLSEEAMASFAQSFGARMSSGGTHDEGACACHIFAEVTGNEHMTFLVDSCAGSVADAFAYSDGDLGITAQALNHALIVAMAYGMSYGRLDMLGDAPDARADGYSWDLSDDQLQKLSESDYWSE